MKKTALTMTDSERQGSSGTDKVPGPSDFSRTLQEENRELKSIVEQQEMVMDMIMRKYREQMTSLVKTSHLDIRRLYYKRFSDTIVSQANKMDAMTKMMRKNLGVIFKYEDIMRQMESENSNLRNQIGQLTLAAKEAMKKSDFRSIKTDAESQTDSINNHKASVGTSTEDYFDIVGKDKAQGKLDKCTDMIPYTPLSSVYFRTLDNICEVKSLNVEVALAADDSAAKTVMGGISLAEDAGKFEELNTEDVTTTTELLPHVDELSSDMSILSLTEDSCSKEDNVLSTSL